jgi:hypothetical protein
MNTLEVIENLKEWRVTLKQERHPITLSLNAAITTLQELHTLAVQMAAFTGRRPEELEPMRDTFAAWEERVEAITGTGFFDAVTKYPPLGKTNHEEPATSDIIPFTDEQPSQHA